MCHEIPLLPNQSLCDSRYIWGINFMAQSLMMSTVLLLMVPKMSCRAWSWRTDLSWWHFHDCIARLAVPWIYNASSKSSLLGKETSLMSRSISLIAISKASQCSHLLSCLCSHCFRRVLSEGSLVAYTLQWSAICDSSLTCTYDIQKNTFNNIFDESDISS